MSGKPRADAGSLVVSYLWQQHGHAALKAELGMSIEAAFQMPAATVYAACRELSLAGWVDLLDDDGIPSARLTPEAVAALRQHASTGAELPERLERASERAARVAQESASAQREQVQILREVREEARRASADAAALRLEVQRLREQALPGPRPVQALPGPGPAGAVFLTCKTCKGSGVGPAGVAAGAPCPTCKGRGEVPVTR